MSQLIQEWIKIEKTKPLVNPRVIQWWTDVSVKSHTQNSSIGAGFWVWPKEKCPYILWIYERFLDHASDMAVSPQTSAAFNITTLQ